MPITFITCPICKWQYEDKNIIREKSGFIKCCIECQERSDLDQKRADQLKIPNRDGSGYYPTNFKDS